MVNTKVKTLKPKRVTSLVKDSPIFGETKDVDLDDLFSKGSAFSRPVVGPISAASDRKPDDLSPSKSHKRRQTEALAVAESANEQIAASSTSNKRLSTSPLEESDISDEDCSGGEDLVHESLQHASSKTKRNPASSKKYTPPDETPSDRDRRTVFVGNLPIEVVQKKAALRQFRTHLLSFARTAKIESIRFRSVPFASATSGIASDEPEKDEAKRTKREKERAAAWRVQQEVLESGDKRAEEEVDRAKTFIDSKGKRKVAFIKKDFHPELGSCNAYIVFAYPHPDRPKNVVPILDPFLAVTQVLAANSSVFMDRLIRVDSVRLPSSVALQGTVTALGKRDAWLPGGTDPKKSVFVGGLDYAAREEDVRVFFEELVKKERGNIGERNWVTGVRIVRDKETQLGKGFGYVHFIDRESVDELLAMNSAKLEFAKKLLRVQPCKTLPPTSSTKRIKASDTEQRSSQPKPSRLAAVLKGNPDLGDKLKNLTKEERKLAKSVDADRQARRLAKKKSKARTANGTTGHTPLLEGSTESSPVRRAASPASGEAPHGTNGQSDEYYTDDEIGESSMVASTGMGIVGGSDEMLMTLLASQAVVDCEELSIGGWEEVESWKKELSLLSNRLSALVARHQREIKILTAARTLQKLNNANKRMSKQTMESLEQSEKRVEAAEKEVLILRDREAVLRRQLMEHWSGVMAWEVRRLERRAASTQSRNDRQSQRIATNKDRERKLYGQIQAFESALEQKIGRMGEMEERVEEMRRRERASEEEVLELDRLKRELEREKEGWMGEKSMMEKDQQSWGKERIAYHGERQRWRMEKEKLLEEKEAMMRERQTLMENGRMSNQDQVKMERLRVVLGGMLGRKGGLGEADVVGAVEEARKLLEMRENEVVRLKEDMREVNLGLEEEVRRLSIDRDGWKGRVERAEQGRKEDHTEQISDLNLRNESLSTSLVAAQSAVSEMPYTSASHVALQNRVDALTTELESIAGQFNEVWSLLPHPSRRVDAELIDRRTGASNTTLMSPSKAVDFGALQSVYVPTTEKFSGIDEMLNRIRGMVDDGRLLVERVVRLGKERELLKSNATKAKKLVEDSRHSLETYQQQVAVLEDRLASSGSTESRSLEELNSLRAALDDAAFSKRNFEVQATTQAETCERLSAANDALSTRALTLADEAEREKRSLQKRLQDEIEELKKKVENAQEDADEQRTRGQAQRIQLLDELNSLQAEVGDLRKQLRSAQRGTPGK
ncbi:MAG: hypothetical protein TREMPRED_004251 [Tremellales sp. Tagirdzhanova-0007]|nr:MAG: hypothetical protein TREMPRED_004251 [Tremellales sp. Tagirdzhanova-0007]